MASIRALVDRMLSSSDYELLQKEGTKVEEAMEFRKEIKSSLLILYHQTLVKVVLHLNYKFFYNHQENFL